MSSRSPYRTLFRSVCRLLLWANGPGERHEYVAMLLVAMMVLMNLISLSFLTERFAGFSIFPSYEVVFLLPIYIVLVVLHYVFLVRDGEMTAYIESGAPSDGDWLDVAGFAYIAGSILVLLISR